MRLEEMRGLSRKSEKECSCRWGIKRRMMGKGKGGVRRRDVAKALEGLGKKRWVGEEEKTARRK